jgi:putative membrane protein insertion efficiency factor
MATNAEKEISQSTALRIYWFTVKALAYPLMFLIRGYQMFISPVLPSTCRFIPTCSEYSLQALRKYGILKGGWLSVKRVARCHPWGGHGHDPVP